MGKGRREISARQRRRGSEVTGLKSKKRCKESHKVVGGGAMGKRQSEAEPLDPAHECIVVF